MKIFFLAAYTVIALGLQGQNDTSVFSKMKKVEVNEYVFEVPEKWKSPTALDVSSKDRKFDFTGVGLPGNVNNAPLTASFTLRKYECKSIKAAEDYLLSELTSYPDRVTPPGYNYEKDSMQIASGEKAALFSTHYLRRSKLLNFTRVDMAVYSKKRKAAYMFTVIYQYKDPTYAIEKELNFRQYAVTVFKTLLLR